MAVSLVGAASPTIQGNPIDYPAGVAAGDLVLLYLVGPQVPPPGFTELATDTINDRHLLCSRTRQAGDPASQVTTTSTAAAGALMVVYRGGVGPAVVDVTSPSSPELSNPGDPHDLTVPSLTASAPGVLACFYDCSGSSAFSAPSGMTQRAADDFSWRCRAYDQVIAVAGATGPRTSSITNGPNAAEWRAGIVVKEQNTAPNAPVLGTPTNAATVDLAAGSTFTASFSDPDTGDSASALAFRRKTGGGAYEYWNEGAGVWQSTLVWFARTGTALSVVFGAGKWVNGLSSQWSMATKDALAVEGPFAADRTVVAGTASSVTVTGPLASVTTTSRPTVTWSVFDAEGDAQERYEAKVFTAAQYGAGGFDPSTSASTWGSGEQISADARSHAVGIDLVTGTTYRAYVRVRSAGQWSPWAFRAFTVSITPPSAPTVVVTPEPVLSRVRLAITGTHSVTTFPSTGYRATRIAPDGSRHSVVASEVVAVPAAFAGFSGGAMRVGSSAVGTGRIGGGPPSGPTDPTVVIYDYEAPAYLTATYEVTAEATV